MEYPRNSYWHETATINTKKSTDVNEKKYDVLIIGAGLTGLNTAYLLKDTGYKIGIIEGTNLGYGVSGYSSAKISIQHNLIYDYLINNFSLEEAKQYLKANLEGQSLIKEIIRENNIQCDYKEQTSYVYATKENEIDMLRKELEAYKKLSIDGFYDETIDIPNNALGAIGIKNQGQFNPIKYLYSLYNLLKNNSSCEIYENVRALNIEPASKGNFVKTQYGNIYANNIIVASHYPFDNDFGLYFLRLYQEKSYVMAVKTNSNQFDGMYINVNDPIYSMRYQFSDKENLLILAGGNHKVGIKDNEEDSYNDLENFLKQNFRNYEIKSRWSTQDCMTYDKIPYIGKYSDNIETIYVATGYNKWGITHSAASAIIIRNKILKIQDDFSEIYNPSRITPVLSSKEFFSNSKDIASGFIKRIIPASDNIFNVKSGEGKIVNYDGRKVGVYKDESGDYFCINPVCTHLKCSLSFNEAEKTWDCQCHGSRFDIRGKILEGPAVRSLNKIKIKKTETN